jgi:AraC-like DNA-binding protein
LNIEELIDNTIVRELIALYNSIPNLQFWIKNCEGEYVKTNYFFLRNYLFLADSEIIGKTDYDIAPQYIAEQWHIDDDIVLTGQCITNRIELVCQPDLSISWNVTNKRPIMSADNSVIGSCGTTRKFEDTEPSELPFNILMPAIEYIRLHIDKPILVETLASLVSMSMSTFERKFKKYFNESPLKFIKKLRLHLACQKLISTELSIAEIATMCGFCNQSYMTKEFHRVIGITPSDYKAAPYKHQR